MPPASPARIGAVLITCEHGGNRIPPPYRPLFLARSALLHSHRGWDPGSLPLAKHLAHRLSAPLIAATTSRLLIDLNRSLDNPSLFSAITAPLPAADRARIIADHYAPYRTSVEKHIRLAARHNAPVLHLSIHTFTPILRGARRATDIGLLFDPARPLESEFCRAWLRHLTLAPHAPPSRTLRVHANRPYKGTDDGLTTHLRTLFPPTRYLGIELEVNQRFPRRGGPQWRKLQPLIARSLSLTLERRDTTPEPPIPPSRPRSPQK